MAGANTITYEQYRATRFFPQLDGLRAISILLVLTIHSHVTELRFLNGYTGVTIFFVLSGYLITTLLLREHDGSGKVRICAFYIRRAFRLLPLYYLVLAANLVAILAGFGENPGDFGKRLVFFLTYLNEFASPGTFGHSWSLAIEEKFYLVWPLLAFAFPALWKWRPWIAGVLAVAAGISGVWGGYLSIYAPIVFGCVVALLLHNERGFAITARLTRPLPAAGLAAIAIVVLFLSRTDSHNQVVFGLAFAALLPVLLVGPHPARRWLEWKPFPFVGGLAYAIYLIHPLVGSVIDAALPDTSALPWSVLQLILMTGLSIVAAYVLHVAVEKPLTQLGRRLARSKRQTGQLPAEPVRA